MHFLEQLKNRGRIQDISDAEGIKKLENSPFYIGFEPTATSLQLGNFIQIVTIAYLAKLGLKPIVLFGGATGLIGDPSGKSSERPLLSPEEINANVRRQTAQVEAIFNRIDVKATFVNNLDWIKDLSLIDFYREVGKHLTLNYMTAKEMVKTRMAGDGISYTEFSYMLLQGFDFMHLYQNYDCKLQLGGSDQWGNITCGLELIRKKLGGQAYGLSVPLLLKADGKKFGKSESGTIWLDADLTSPYQLHQFLLNSTDADVIKLLQSLTLIENQRISEIEDNMKSNSQSRAAQQILADNVVELIHGAEAVEVAKKAGKVLFDNDLAKISDKELLEIFKDVPAVSIAKSELNELKVGDLFLKTSAVKSKGELKRLSESNGLYVLGKPCNNLDLPASQFSARDVIVIRTGKKNNHLIQIV